jgi:hypothetical protein
MIDPAPWLPDDGDSDDDDDYNVRPEAPPMANKKITYLEEISSLKMEEKCPVCATYLLSFKTYSRSQSLGNDVTHT